MQISKWGNSLAVSLPAAVIEVLALKEGDDIINKSLLPHLHRLDLGLDGTPNPSASRKQRTLGRIMTAVERVRVDSETNLADILDRVHRLSIVHIDDTHFFTLSQVYEDLLLKMGEKNSDGGQFFTPREVIRAMVLTLDPPRAKRSMTLAAAPAGFSPRHSATWRASSATRPPQPRSSG